VYAVTRDTFYKSTDTGTTFSSVTRNLPNTSGRFCLDVTPADANYVYILSSTTGDLFQGVYRSVDSGDTWAKISTNATPDVFDGSGQSDYDMALGVSSTDKNLIFTGVLNVWKSANGGAAFTKVNSWSEPTGAAYTHADIHFLRYYGNKFYAGTDGGIYVSNDNGTTFTDLTGGLQISQFYKVAVSKQSASKMVGGLQDNGGYAYTNNAWKNYYGADGMDTAVNPYNSNSFYGFIQYGGSLYNTSDGGASLGTGVGAPSAETSATDDGGIWITPLTMNSVGELFAGYTRLYKLDACDNWVQQSSGTIGVGDVELISVAPSNDDIMFVSNGTQLYKSTNRGITFNLVFTASSSITSISIHYSNSNIIYLTTSGTAGLALKSVNGGTTFNSFSENLPSIGKNVIKHQGRHSLNPLYLGTSLGVYYRDDSMSQWEPFDTNLPNVSVRDLEINLEDSVLIAATYGRGIWQTTIPNESVVSDIKIVEVTSPTTLIDCGNTISPVVSVKNNGTTSISQVTLTYNYGTGNQNYTWNGTIAPNASQNIAIPNVNVAALGKYDLSITATVTGDAYSDNNTGKVPFYINATETFNKTYTFETAADNLLSSSTNCAWVRGINTNGALSTTENNVYTVGQTTNYPNNRKEFLYTKCYNLTGVVNPLIKFKMGFALEQDYDVLYVEYTTDMGQTWSVLGTQGPSWYNSNNNCSSCKGAQWTGGSGAPNTGTGAVPSLTNYSYSLSSLIGQSQVIFRFVFHSDSSVNDLGVTIDDFAVEGTFSNQEFELKNVSIYPNPSNAIFTINTGDQIIENIQVYDVSGKVISDNKKINASEFKLNLDQAASGVYFVKIESETQKAVKRIIKN
jgi:Secretion system C-terminal sorting domain